MEGARTGAGEVGTVGYGVVEKEDADESMKVV